MSVRLTTRRTVTALATVAALAVAAAPASAGTRAAEAAGPPAAHAFKGKLTKAQQARMRKAAKTPAGSPKLAIQGKDSVSVFCGRPYIGNWGGYTLRCHIVVVGGPYGYTDWYEYDYWNGYQWNFWFNALS
jgi:hypothetical protein